MFQELLENLRAQKSLIHCITNYVTANDCANLLLACGASPIMADDPAEAADITALSAGLVLNIGTLHQAVLPAMEGAGRRARALGHPVVLDPVGAGASAFRTAAARRLLEEVHPTLLRGNASELKALAGGRGDSRGVDAAAADRVTPQNLDQMAAFVKALSARTGAVVAMTGAIDLVSDASTTFCIYNGHPAMGRVTGTGCQLSALSAAFLAANPDAPLAAAAAAVCAMGLCGEIAYARLGPQEGNATYRNYIIDAMDRLAPDTLEQGARYEMR